MGLLHEWIYGLLSAAPYVDQSLPKTGTVFVTPGLVWHMTLGEAASLIVSFCNFVFLIYCIYCLTNFMQLNHFFLLSVKSYVNLKLQNVLHKWTHLPFAVWEELKPSEETQMNAGETENPHTIGPNWIKQC